jgi:hypothetical protein
MNAHDILQAAAGHMNDRAATYDKPKGERSMSATVAAFKAVSGISMTEEQGWLFMALLKAVRSQQGAYRADSYEDGAAYFALAGEAAYGNRGEPSIARMAEGFGQQHTFEPAAEIDDESDRIHAIGQNGNGGEHYAAPKTIWPDWASHRLARIDSPLSGSQFVQECHGAYLSVKGRAFNMNRWHIMDSRPCAN